MADAPDARQVLAGVVLNTFGSLVERRLELKALIKQAEGETKEIDEAITSILTDADAPKVQYGNATVQLCQGSRSTLQKDKLIEAGVAPAVLERCTKTTAFTYVLVK